jgi:uncharacterized protein YbaR (Trm112 family)
MLDSRLLEILVCPKCRGKLTVQEEPPALLCATCRVAYPIRDGIPVLLIDQATPTHEE